MSVSWPCQNQPRDQSWFCRDAARAMVQAEPDLLQAGKGRDPLHCQEPSGRQLMSKVALLWVSPVFPGWRDSLSAPRPPAGRGAEGLTGRASHAAPGAR